jgi:hypothetical protein
MKADEYERIKPYTIDELPLKTMVESSELQRQCEGGKNGRMNE